MKKQAIHPIALFFIMFFVTTAGGCQNLNSTPSTTPASPSVLISGPTPTSYPLEQEGKTPTTEANVSNTTRSQIQAYKKLYGNDIPKEIKPVKELQGKSLILRDAVGGYADNKLVEKYLLFSEEKQGQSSPILVMLNEQGEPIVFQTGLWRKFSTLSIYPLAENRKELILFYKYGDKQAVETFYPQKSLISEIHESDKVSILGNGDIISTSLFDQDGIRRLVMQTFRISEGEFILTDTAAEIKTAETMDFLITRPTKQEVEYLKTDIGNEVFDTAAENLILAEKNKPELEATLLTDPSKAIKQAQEILGTTNPLLVAEGMKKAMEDLYAVDTKTSEAEPIWNYFLEYQEKQGEVKARVNVDAIVVYTCLTYALSQTELGNIPLPWAGGQSLAVVVARDITKDIADQPGGTYLTITIKEEDGKLNIGGDIEVGSRAVQLYENAKVYGIIAQSSYQELQSYMNDDKWKGDVNAFLKKTDELSKETQKQLEIKKQEQARILKQKSNELTEDIGAAVKQNDSQKQVEYEKQKQEIERKLSELQKIPKYFEDFLGNFL
jgi:hypothetical protein